ncbi:hypothetical protein SAMN05216525_104159 [Bradyrhizobium sp. Gha]|nr:hypothetical protein SAMN05216525_104159 [Bradyrhizobium sp. Gha]
MTMAARPFSTSGMDLSDWRGARLQAGVAAGQESAVAHGVSTLQSDHLTRGPAGATVQPMALRASTKAKPLHAATEQLS